MRGSKAKMLRRLAKKLSIGMPERKLVMASLVNRRTAVNASDSTRGIYLALKKGRQP